MRSHLHRAELDREDNIMLDPENYFLKTSADSLYRCDASTSRKAKLTLRLKFSV